MVADALALIAGSDFDFDEGGGILESPYGTVRFEKALAAIAITVALGWGLHMMGRGKLADRA